MLVHPGGPWFADKDAGSWGIPKGAVAAEETAVAAACREFGEETGLVVPPVGIFSIGTITQRGGKRVHAWAFLGTCDPADVRSNTFVMEWPRGSGRMRRFPEIDRAAFFAAEAARARILPAQRPFIDRAQAGLAQWTGGRG
jgi:predicted NUDIX family NTP pyrophosphohydrolase